MRDRLFDWLADKACDYFRWYDDRERRLDKERNGTCPDCECGVNFCYCDERDMQSRMARSIYEEGIDEGYNRAARDTGMPY